MKELRFRTENFLATSDIIDDAVLSDDDPLHQIKSLAGIGQQITEANPSIANRNGNMSTVGSNISITGMEKRRLEKEHNIKPGTDEWFRLWFTRPYLTNTSPLDPKFKK
jgi:hypothetical protein